MQGVTTGIVIFVLMCLIWPQIVKVRGQYYAAVGCVLVIILLDAVAVMFGSRVVDAGGAVLSSGAFSRFVYVMSGLLQIVAIVMLVLATGGLSVSELVDDVKGSYEVTRRGDEGKEIIIPLPPDAPRPMRNDEPERVVYKIDDPVAPIPPDAPATPVVPPRSSEPLPVEPNKPA